MRGDEEEGYRIVRRMPSRLLTVVTSWYKARK